jgi:hypothetical protein
MSLNAVRNLGTSIGHLGSKLGKHLYRPTGLVYEVEIVARHAGQFLGGHMEGKSLRLRLAVAVVGSCENGQTAPGAQACNDP